MRGNYALCAMHDQPFGCFITLQFHTDYSCTIVFMFAAFFRNIF